MRHYAKKKAVDGCLIFGYQKGNILAKNLKEHRHKSGISQAKLAEKEALIGIRIISVAQDTQLHKNKTQDFFLCQTIFFCYIKQQVEETMQAMMYMGLA